MKAYTLVLISFLFTSSAFAAKPQIQWNSEYDFSETDTFQWRDASGNSLSESDPFLHSRIVNAIEFELTGHGLTEVSTDPQVFVTYHLSTHSDYSIRADTVGYSFGRYGRGGWGYYGYGTAVPMSTTADIVEVERGTLVVDVWDAQTDELVWRGTSSDIHISDDPSRTQRNAEKAIEKMAKQYRKLLARGN